MLRMPRNDWDETVPTTNHLNPPTGNMADNVIGFARALRAAGLPVGPGAVIDAMNALQMIEVGNRSDFYTTLESVFGFCIGCRVFALLMRIGVIPESTCEACVNFTPA